MAAVTTNREAADVLFNVATILELSQDNPYRIRAYRRAARLLLRSPEDARVKLTDKRELDLPGLGIRLRRKLGVDAVLDGHRTQLLEPDALGVGERLVREVSQRRSTPQCEGTGQRLPGRLRLLRGEEAAALLGLHLEAAGVDLVGCDL